MAEEGRRAIAKDEPIVEIITDKINIELPAPSAGTLGQIAVAEGVVAPGWDTLGVILGPGESLPAAGGAPAAKAPAAPARAPPRLLPQHPPGPAMSAPVSMMTGTAVATAPPSTDGARPRPRSETRQGAQPRRPADPRIRHGRRVTREGMS
jgi:2-oxoglutarate dehydrogenase E2 component (dihydrolipoamide succinyltransferase)